MSWHYLQEQGEEFSVDAYLAGIRSERSKSTATRANACCSGNGTESCLGYLTRNTEEKKEEEQDEPFKVTHNPHAKQFEVIAITPDMTPMYIIPYSTAINAHKNYRIETARARAEAECARLNAEHRKKNA